MIYFDTTKTGRAGHRSGLNRVSGRLRSELGGAAAEAIWDGGLRSARGRKPIRPAADDWFVTSELFSEPERPGFTEFLSAPGCRTAAIFHDAIPLKHPHITWPQSVARHPGYLKLLRRFHHVWAVSAASRDELLEFWQWQEEGAAPPVEVLTLGADFTPGPRVTSRVVPPGPPLLLALGIIEPRKNQALLVDLCSELWADGLAFELHLVGRVNPHFGPPVLGRIKAGRRLWKSYLHFHDAAADAAVLRLYARARATVFPTLAEGCGLPLLESLWMGVPCVCSDLPVLRENAGGGCVPVAVNDRAAWKDALRRIVTDRSHAERLTAEATTRPLPTWSGAARTILGRCR